MQTIKVYGERNTGTVYLEWLLSNNFQVNISDTPDLGWKHRLAPHEDELSSTLKNEVAYLCLVKNPYSWLLSMHKRPYQHKELRKLSFSNFLRYSYGDYRNPIVMWNIKNRSYINMENYVEHIKIIRYEDLIADFKHILNTLANSLGFEIPGIYKNMNNLLSNSKGVIQQKFHKEFYLNEQWKRNLKSHHLDHIKQFLDQDLMNQLNYKIL